MAIIESKVLGCLRFFTVLCVAMLMSVIAANATMAAFNTAAGKESVEYRLEAWKTVHADPGAEGDKLIATLKKLRCEVKVESHGNHKDVQYRCPEWKSMELKDHNAVVQWEKWLKKYGFETKHTH